MDEKNVQNYTHTVFLRDGEKISITGVIDVLTFDEETVILDTDRGMLTLRGMDLHVQRLDLERQELELEGELESLVYSHSHSYGRDGGSLLSKLFK
ncbi:MAG: sporulation protein YabP [Epulopiscium sp.]|nr:sporulation protein YabP [Candidatus Epulonipiscium sp.]